MTTLISANETWALWAVLLLAAAGGIWSQRTLLGARLSAAVVTMLITALLSNLNVIPATSTVYSVVWNYLVPVSIPLLLFQVNLPRIMQKGASTLILFVIGIVGIVAGVFVAYLLVPMENVDWQVASIFTAQYIGDTLNYQQVASEVGPVAGSLLSGGLQAVSLIMVIYLLLLFVLLSFYRLRVYFPETPDPDRFGSTQHILKRETVKGNRLNPLTLTTSFAFSALLCALSYAVEKWSGWPGLAILLIVLVPVIMAVSFPGMMIKMEGASEVAMMIMLMLFATLGASANIPAMLQSAPLLFVYSAIVLLVHLVFVITAARLLRRSLTDVVIASSACVGNPLIAAGVAATRRWNNLLLPAVVCALLGYLVANHIALYLGKLLH